MWNLNGGEIERIFYNTGDKPEIFTKGLVGLPVGIQTGMSGCRYSCLEGNFGYRRAQGGVWAFRATRRECLSAGYGHSDRQEHPPYGLCNLTGLCNHTGLNTPYDRKPLSAESHYDRKTFTPEKPLSAGSPLSAGKTLIGRKPSR